MKYCFLLSVLALIIISCDEVAETTSNETTVEHITLTYDSLKAEEFGADQYGMKAFVMAFLYRGTNDIQDTAEVNRLQRAHMSNINRLAEAGSLVLAGPFFGTDSLRGIYIFNTPSLDTAKVWTNSDPAIQKNWLTMDLKPWYGSAALVELSDRHAIIAKENI